MARVRKIQRNPSSGMNHFVVDANFLANKFVPGSSAPDAHQKIRIERCCEWWEEIDAQVGHKRARVYAPDICVAEAFKVLAKKYYEEQWFKTAVTFNNARLRLRKFITTPTRTLRAARRHIKFHDISTTRDIIISVDRFYEAFHKHKKKVQLPDLIVVATAKYLLDFYDVPKQQLHIVTLDRALREGSKFIQELPNAYDPTEPSDSKDIVFTGDVFRPRRRKRRKKP
ncbi:MAG: hypothetical protein ACE15D_13235 [Candidatus Eisenbacteria bacterium]